MTSRRRSPPPPNVAGAHSYCPRWRRRCRCTSPVADGRTCFPFPASLGFVEGQRHVAAAAGRKWRFSQTCWRLIHQGLLPLRPPRRPSRRHEAAGSQGEFASSSSVVVQGGRQASPGEGSRERPPGGTRPAAAAAAGSATGGQPRRTPPEEPQPGTGQGGCDGRTAAPSQGLQDTAHQQRKPAGTR